ncbi:protein-glutamate O-methyltransferase CheR [Cyanothece sp. BG0011]|uniref:CheR family methyltransferase n=1 Tax=Cyanothece sp. BG0011 TaxID=2082950 RepID=UPI000D1ED7EF|nr:CheR family methyltransferase [Cyanothece sp. BG0011]
MNQEYQRIEQLLAQKIGLGPDKLGQRQLIKAVTTRQKACEIPRVSDYLKRLQSSAQEFQELVEQIVIPETWFFRHREAFSLLRHFVQTEWLQSHPRETLRILCVPCSTGEEPYSVAMTLLNSPLSPQQFTVEGMDISQTALTLAKKGSYGKNSFRSHDRLDYQQFFEVKQNRYQICPSIRNQVQFSCKNLLSPWSPSHPPYHVIFCRHLLIYLDEDSRDRVLKTLDRLLWEGGLLFVGAVETTLIKAPHFRFVSHPSAFAYQKVSLSQPDVRLKRKPYQRSPLKPRPAASLPQPTKQEIQLSSLQMAQQLANRGKLKEAAQCCQTHLRGHPIDAEGYLLLGEISQAQGNLEEAQQCFQKALYLRPNYREALVHLALLRESQGDTQGAAILKHRIQRLDNLQG